ncbi:hypothetical protein AAZX31_03G102000 [Glycine max]
MEIVDIRSFRSIAKIVGTVMPVSGATSIALLKGDNWLLDCLSLIGSTIVCQSPASKSHLDHLSFSGWMCFMATLQSAMVTLFVEQDLNAWKIRTLLELIVMGSALLFFLQAWCFSRRGPLFSAMLNPLFTVIATVLAAILLHEEIYVGSLLGAIGVIIGLYVVLWGKAEEVVVKVKEDAKSMVNSTEDVNMHFDKSI